MEIRPGYRRAVNQTVVALLSLVALWALAVSGASGTPPAGAPERRPPGRSDLTLERVARYPPPGTRIPSAFRFSHDGRFLYYLDFEGEGTARVLVREEVATGLRAVVGRPPAERGEGGETLTREEILRRERRRIQDTGITLFALAARADVAVFAWGADLFLVRPGAEPLRLTRTGAAEIDPQPAPDGRRVAFVRDGDLYVLDLDTLAETRLTAGARDGVTRGLAEYIAQEEMDRATGFWWSPDGASIAYTEVDETGIPPYPIIHHGGPPAEIEWHRYPFAGGPNARVRLGVIRSTGGRTRWLSLGPETGDGYLARVRWDHDGSLLVQVQARDQRTLRLLRVDPRGGSAATLVEERSETWINLHEDLRPLAAGGFLWSSESSGHRHLELRDRDGAPVRVLTGGAWAVDRLEGVDEKGGWVYFTAARDGPLEKHLYRVRLEGGEPERVTHERGFHDVTVSPDGSHFVDVHQSLRTPPRVFLREAAGRVARILDPNDDPEVQALGLRPPELVTVRAADGAVLHGALYRPDPVPGRRHPAIVRVYGGPTAQTVKDAWDLTADLRAQHLARRGFVVLRLDNRGTPRRGRVFETALHRRLGSIEVEDQAAGARWLASQPYVDGSRIGIYGWSYGGYMAALCLLREPDLFRAAVAGAPVVDWDGYDTHYTERYLGTPGDQPEAYRNASLLPLAPRLRGALLIIHGMIDENVHFRHTARLVDALNAAQKTYDLLVFPGERHLPRKEEDRVHMERRLLEHFEARLGPPRK
jgi:dipeptidyl-peptidase-4